MIEIVRERDVGTAPESVWAVLADFGDISRWAPDVDHSWALTEPGPDAARRIQSGRLTVIERVLTWEPPRSLAYAIDGLPPVLRRVVNEWRLAPTVQGTRVSITTTIDAGPRPPKQLVARVVARRLATMSDRMLAGLAARVEPDPARGAR